MPAILSKWDVYVYVECHSSTYTESEKYARGGFPVPTASKSTASWVLAPVEARIVSKNDDMSYTHIRGKYGDKRK